MDCDAEMQGQAWNAISVGLPRMGSPTKYSLQAPVLFLYLNKFCLFCAGLLEATCELQPLCSHNIANR